MRAWLLLPLLGSCWLVSCWGSSPEEEETSEVGEVEQPEYGGIGTGETPSFLVGMSPEDLPPPADGFDMSPEDVGDAIPIHFFDLSLLGVDIDALFEWMFGDERPEGFEFPNRVQELHGQEVSIVGYVIGLDRLESDDRYVTHFMLVRDLASCCFGGMPRPDEWVDVYVEEPCLEHLYKPVRVTGKFSAGVEFDETGFTTSVFQIKGAWARLEPY